MLNCECNLSILPLDKAGIIGMWEFEEEDEEEKSS